MLRHQQTSRTGPFFRDHPKNHPVIWNDLNLLRFLWSYGFAKPAFSKNFPPCYWGVSLGAEKQVSKCLPVLLSSRLWISPRMTCCDVRNAAPYLETKCNLVRIDPLTTHVLRWFWDIHEPPIWLDSCFWNPLKPGRQPFDPSCISNLRLLIEARIVKAALRSFAEKKVNRGIGLRPTWQTVHNRNRSGFHKWGRPKNARLFHGTVNPMKMDDLGVPAF